MSLEEIYQKFVRGECSREEMELLLKAFGLPENELLLRSLIRVELEQAVSETNPMMPDLVQKQQLIFRNIHFRLFHSGKTKPVRRLWARLAVAAAAIITVCAGSYLLFSTSSGTKGERDGGSAIVFPGAGGIIQPGKTGAILTLADGKKVVLEQARPDTVISQSGSRINVLDSSLVYKEQQAVNRAKRAFDPATYNSLETPNGRQFSLTLSDGTRVWLNAGSSLRYPVAFTGNERVVTLTGEAYFEIRHDNRRPFRIITDRQLIEDIGTRFDVNAYDDEPAVTTTLLEGAVSVRVNGAGEDSRTLLKPGQAAQLLKGKRRFVVSTVNAEDAIAWKNGLFKFNHTDVPSVMRQMARWYNIQVEYEGKAPVKTLTGAIYRSVTAEEALQILHYAHIPFKIENKRIIITQN